VFNWLERSRRGPLSGAPAVRRLKTYSAQSGYVYQYFYCGQRSYRRGTEFVFEVSPDRGPGTPLSVKVPREAVTHWEQAHGRELRSNEWYAIAKMALFQAFDEQPDPARLAPAIGVDAAGVEALLGQLGVE
jgi:hypothetical protein